MRGCLWVGRGERHVAVDAGRHGRRRIVRVAGGDVHLRGGPGGRKQGERAAAAQGASFVCRESSGVAAESGKETEGTCESGREADTAVFAGWSSYYSLQRQLRPNSCVRAADHHFTIPQKQRAVTSAQHLSYPSCWPDIPGCSTHPRAALLNTLLQVQCAAIPCRPAAPVPTVPRLRSTWGTAPHTADPGK